jgi:hypothetical protein
MFSALFKKWIGASDTTRLYRDFTRGVFVVRDQLVAAPDHIFLTIDTIRLQHRLSRINKKLFEAYKRLGEQGIEYFNGNFPRIAAEEIEQIYHQIEMILEDQKRVIAEIEEVEASTIAQNASQDEKNENRG